MVTLKEYEIYLKVKRTIEGFNEADIISPLINDTDPIKYYSLSVAARDCGVSK